MLRYPCTIDIDIHTCWYKKSPAWDVASYIPIYKSPSSEKLQLQTTSHIQIHKSPKSGTNILHSDVQITFPRHLSYIQMQKSPFLEHFILHLEAQIPHVNESHFLRYCTPPYKQIHLSLAYVPIAITLHTCVLQSSPIPCTFTNSAKCREKKTGQRHGMQNTNTKTNQLMEIVLATTIKTQNYCKETRNIAPSFRMRNFLR